MKEIIVATFPHSHTNNCFELETVANFHIEDSENDNTKCWIHKDDTCEEFPRFKVINPNEKEIHFLAIDHCLFGNEDDKKCDCVVFDNNTFCFIELKKGFAAKSRGKKRHDAIQQLKTTILIFKHSLDFANYRLEAYPCVGYKRSHPRAKSSNNSLIIEFDKLDVELCEGNEREFI